jgi:hypothetical protein
MASAHFFSAIAISASPSSAVTSFAFIDGEFEASFGFYDKSPV